MGDSTEVRVLDVKFEALVEDTQQTRVIVEGIDRALRGSNGDVGLIAKVKGLEDDVGTAKKMAIGSVVSVVLTAIGTVVTIAVKKLLG